MHVGTFVSLILFAFTVSASDVYVSSTGTATAPYDSWSTAFTSVQVAFDYAQTNAVVSNIYLKGETFAAAADGTKVYFLASRSDLAVRGGYEGV